MELPQSNISLDASLSQKVKTIIAREKDLEQTIEKIEAEYKARIVELKARALGMPPAEHEAQVAELKGCAMTIDTRLVETPNLLDEAMQTWMTMDEIDGLIKVHASLKKN